MKPINMSRVIIAIFVFLIGFASCSSPKQEGENQAEAEREMWEKYVQNTIMAYTNFVKEFGSKNYQTRVQAREELNMRIDEVESKLATQRAELDAKYSALRDKYAKDHGKLEEMYRAYTNSISAYKMDTTQFAVLRNQAHDKILTIIPPTPVAEKLQKDLIGRVVKALPGGYLSSYWSWTIEPGEIKDLKIVNVEDVDKKHKEFWVDMTLQADGAAYKTKGKIYYVLDNRDDWEIDMLEPSEVEVVKTGRYDSSITTSFYNMILSERIDFHNNSDAALLVGFRTLDGYGNYEKHSVMVSGGETVSYSALVLKDYTIDFVERP